MKKFTVIASNKANDAEAQICETIINHIYEKSINQACNEPIKSDKGIMVSTPMGSNSFYNKMIKSYDFDDFNQGRDVLLTDYEIQQLTIEQWIFDDINSTKEPKDKPKSKHNHWLQSYTKRKHRG